jgi:hypothetical protein
MGVENIGMDGTSGIGSRLDAGSARALRLRNVDGVCGGGVGGAWDTAGGDDARVTIKGGESGVEIDDDALGAATLEGGDDFSNAETRVVGNVDGGPANEAGLQGIGGGKESGIEGGCRKEMGGEVASELRLQVDGHKWRKGYLRSVEVAACGA